MPSSELSKWADSAMYSSAPTPSRGPVVFLLSAPSDPLGQIAAACRMYEGKTTHELRKIDDKERTRYFEQVQRTKLQAPFEFVNFHFFIDGVTRSLTHQMVRQRTAVYAQESLRFAVKEDFPVSLPPSLEGTTSGEHIDVRTDDELHMLPKDNYKRAIWDNAVRDAEQAYKTLVDMGMPAEDARGLLPHNILTRLHYGTNLRALLDHAGNRLCTQAQFEWRLLWARIVEAIRAYPGFLNNNVPSRNAWQFRELAELFKPVCYQTGRCEFKADFDRKCSIRSRVDAHESKGEPSSTWTDIQPAEWLANPSAAR